MSESSLPHAVIGAGLSGAWVAHRLHQQGLRVQVFDKARGPGGRLATRVQRDADDHQLGLGGRHPAPGFSAVSPAFESFVRQTALATGSVQAWSPRLHPASRPIARDPAIGWVGTPDMPALCRQLLDSVPLHTGQPVTALHRSPEGWALEGPDAAQGETFASVILALPPAQAAPLVAPHAPDSATHIAALDMQPCWTLLGWTDTPGADRLDWDLARPEHPLLDAIWRQNDRPLRWTPEGLTGWVLHARPDWSRQWLEADAADVARQMQESLSEFLGHPLRWHHVSAHRWRYATPGTGHRAETGLCWWSDSLGLGACGDAWCPDSRHWPAEPGGVERAWLSSQALADLCLSSAAGRHQQ